MGELLELDRSLIEPVYTQATPNEEIRLGPITVEFSHKGKTYQQTAHGIIEFSPAKGLAIVIPPKPAQPTHRPMTV